MDTMFFLYIGAMLLVMWFFFIRPQSKKAKEQATFSTGVAKGDKVVTTGGIHGKIFKADDNGTILLEVDNNVKIRIERSAISMELTKAAYPDVEKKAESTESK